MAEYSRIDKPKSNIFLIIAILIAVIVTVWIIFSFDDQPGEQDGIGQSGIQKILVSHVTPVINQI
ncbi:MAG: hypothetical protein R6W90_09320 [Ignavibacteriaceae bacterium]